jgi:peptidyl-prolyl cis-trans isomerase-like protein 2
MSGHKQGEKLYMTATEYRESFGGYNKKSEQEKHKLSFDSCNIGLTRITDGNFVCAPDGTVFDILNIIPYLQKYNVHPVTGTPLSVKDLIKLTFHKNKSGNYECPITHNEFTDNSHIVAIKTTGNVYSYEAIEEMNLKLGEFKDFLTETPFHRGDIITIQDPTDKKRYQKNLAEFHHIQEGSKSKEVDKQTNSMHGINMSSETERIMKKVNMSDKKEILYSSGSAGPATKSASLTSSSMVIKTKDQQVDKTDQIRQDAVYSWIKKKNKVGLVTLHTSHGDLGFELFCGAAPKTCQNFLTLCEKGYYDGTIFHRLIPKFMIQGGDPTGTGKGGQSIWDKPFEDEFSKHLHDSDGILSMANSGKNTNKSQFFILFGPAKHLDRKHTVFGKIITGIENLKKIETVPTDQEDKPRVPVTLHATTVVSNPYIEASQVELKRETAPTTKREYGNWYSDPAPKKDVNSDTVGKYLNFSTVDKRKSDDDFGKDKKKTRTNFDFSNW